MKTLLTSADLFRTTRDQYGNPRYVISSDEFISTEEQTAMKFDDRYSLALRRARMLGGTTYRGKDFGGGFVFTSYDENGLIKRINELKEVLNS